MSSTTLDILYVGALPPHPGGSAVSAAQLLGAFAARGHAVRALAPITAAEIAAGDPFAAAQPAIAVTRYIVPRAYTTAYRPADADYERCERSSIDELLPAMIGERRPDVLFVGRESFAWQVPDIAAAHSIPCILRAAGATTVGIVEGTYPPSAAENLIECWRRMNLVITPSQYLAGELRRLGLSRTRVILNAVDLEVFQPAPKDEHLLAELGIDRDAIVIAFVGNLNERKRPLDLVRSSVEVLERCPAVTYVIVGDGPLREEVRRTSRALGVEERFRLVGWQSYERMPRYINLADIVVLPSFGEGLARVYLETQACGRVLIASDIASAREVVEDGENGLLFRVGDVDRLAGRCIQAAQDPELRAGLGRAARKRVARHDISGAVTQYLAAFETMVAPAPPEATART